MKREIFEESGLKIKNPKLVGHISYPNFKNNDWYVFIYIATDFEGNELKENHEGTLDWIDDDNVLKLPLWESDYIFIPWIKQGKFFSAKFVYENDIMIDYDVFFH